MPSATRPGRNGGHKALERSPWHPLKGVTYVVTFKDGADPVTGLLAEKGDVYVVSKLTHSFEIRKADVASIEPR